MSSHVPFLAVRPDENFNSDMKSQDFADTNGFPPSSSDAPMMDLADAPEAPHLTRMPAASRMPAFIRFPLVVLLSFALSTLFYSLVADFAGFELAAVSKELTDEWQVALLLGWKFSELCVAWYAGYDWKDLVSLACLSNLPYYFLLHTFYELHMFSCLTALTIDILSIGIPFALLRPLIHAHEPGKSPNQQVAQDRTIFLLMGLFGSVIYAVFVYGSLYTWLPVHMVTHFDGVRSLQAAHDASIELLICMLVPVGWATTQFLFTPMVGARANPGITDPELHPEKVRFDPENANMGETLAFNLGFGRDGFSKRGEVLAKRTAVLVACSVTNTVVRTFMTISGTELVGCLGWASVWGVAATLTSLAYAWAGNE